MPENRAVAYIEPGKVEVQNTSFPKLELQDGPGGEPGQRGSKNSTRRHPRGHGGRISAVPTSTWSGVGRQLLQDSYSGTRSWRKVIETGPDVEFVKVGDVCSVPFNIACGRCRSCKEGKTGICLNVNPDRPGSAYGYVDMGGWVGGQAQYVLVPYADWNLLVFPDPGQALEKLRDLTMLSDIFPTGFHGALTAGVKPGSTVYVAGAGPVGLGPHAAQLLGAAVVIVGDLNGERLAQARSFGCETLDVSHGAPKDQIDDILGVPEVDCSVDAVGFEARGHGKGSGEEAPAAVLDSLMGLTAAGGGVGIPGLYVTDDPGGVDAAARTGSLSLRLGLGWAKPHSFATGQCPVMRYNRGSTMCILHEKSRSLMSSTRP